jgi:hypothetical protein
MDDGTQTVFGLVDDGPTGHASRSGGPFYHGPGRGGGNSINALLDGWLLTGAPHYLTKAEELLRRCIHPDDDVEALNLLDAEARWSYTVFLSVLARYLDLKAEAGMLDDAYAHAQAALLHYAAWMVEHERTHYDHPEQFGYKTEAWAAHDLRKANVLRLAAAHASQPLRGRLLRRGEELAERAWQDLLRFSTRHSARALAILLTDGTRDAALRAAPPAPRPSAGVRAFPPLAEPFVPQKHRVLARLRSPRGLTVTLVRLLDPRRWPRLRWLWRHL